jgi:hypothetical protein
LSHFCPSTSSARYQQDLIRVKLHSAERFPLVIDTIFTQPPYPQAGSMDEGNAWTLDVPELHFRSSSLRHNFFSIMPAKDNVPIRNPWLLKVASLESGSNRAEFWSDNRGAQPFSFEQIRTEQIV